MEIVAKLSGRTIAAEIQDAVFLNVPDPGRLHSKMKCGNFPAEAEMVVFLLGTCWGR